MEYCASSNKKRPGFTPGAGELFLLVFLRKKPIRRGEAAQVVVGITKH